MHKVIINFTRDKCLIIFIIIKYYFINKINKIMFFCTYYQLLKKNILSITKGTKEVA